jgi:cyclophilin family peptidyl-prolyl cis-trans isomerase
MKSTSLLLAALLLAGTGRLAQADDVAVMEVRFPGVKQTSRVAFEFYEADAPRTVENFKKLARKKFYNGLTFHRAFPHTLVQTGDPYTHKKDRAKVGTGGPGYTLPPEIRRKHTAGAISMARLPDKLNPSRVSNGSQFFVCLTPLPSYDGQYTCFGKVLYGLNVLDAISLRSVDSNDNPIERVTIRSLRIVPREKLPPAVDPEKKPSAKKSWWKIF